MRETKKQKELNFNDLIASVQAYQARLQNLVLLGEEANKIVSMASTIDNREKHRKILKEISEMRDSEDFSIIKNSFRKNLEGFNRFCYRHGYQYMCKNTCHYHGLGSAKEALEEIKKILLEIKKIKKRGEMMNIWVEV